MSQKFLSQDIKKIIHEKFKQELKPDKKGRGYICPICGSGSGAKGTGITENPKAPYHYTCWTGCFKNADAFDIISLLQGVPTGSKQAMLESFKRYNLSDMPSEGPQRLYSRFNGADIVNSTLKKKSEHTSSTGSYEAYVKNSSAKFKGSPAEKYINNRGISSQVAERFKLGYSDNEYFPNGEQHPALIIPIGVNFYIKRNIEQGQRFSNIKGGSSTLFNGNMLINQQNIPVFITESAIDALSIIEVGAEVGAEAVALNSTSNVDLLLRKINDIDNLPPFILCLDADEAGNNATEKLIKTFKEKNLQFIDGRFILNGCKDANEALLQGKEQFFNAVNQAIEDVLNILPSELAEYEQQNAAGFFSEFINNIKTEKNTQAIKTGFNSIDDIFDGGLYSGLYFIGAISSLGKTTFCLQLADQIAMQKQDVLIFSIEMARNELMAKSISRLTFLNAKKQNISTKNAKTTRGITDGQRWANYSKEEKELLQQSLNDYKDKIAPNIWIFEGIGDVGVKQIREKVNKHITLKGRKPVVLIDYVQILTPFDIRATDKQNTDRAVLELKRLSRDFDIPILCISSLNRESYMEPINMKAFKESGAIEYGSDMLIGLQYDGMDYKDGESEKERQKRIRRLIKNGEQNAAQGREINIQLKVLKNRNGKKGLSFNFKFYPMFNCFVEDEIGIFEDIKTI